MNSDEYRSVGRGEGILVVDDDPAICGLLAKVLEAEGYSARVFHHPEHALAASRESSFHLAFVDINMPDMDGLVLATKLKAADPTLEVVFMTGYGTFDNAVQAIKIGAYDYLRKPFTISEFTLCLRRFQERNALRERIRKAEQRYFQLVQNIPLLIFALLRDFSIDFVNAACGVILGQDPEESLHRPGRFLEWIYQEDRDRIRDLLEKAFSAESAPTSAQCRLLHRRQHVIHAILTVLPAYASNELLGKDRLEGIIVDISDRVILERALVQSEKLKTLGTISAEVAHEIRNPLTSIGGFARRIQKRAPELAEPEIILREAERLEALLDRIRNYLRPVTVRSQRCSVKKVLQDSLELLSVEMEQHGIGCRVEVERRISQISADPDILGQVLVNLIRRAIESTDNGGSLSLKAHESSQNVHLEISHPASGPVPKNPELLLLPFDEEAQGGELPLCYRLVKNMGGVLSVTSAGTRTVYTLSLPKHARGETQPETVA